MEQDDAYAAWVNLMSYVFSAWDRPDAFRTDLNLPISDKGEVRISMRILAASPLPEGVCEQWLAGVLCNANRRVELSGPITPSAILMLTNGLDRDLELIGELRAHQPGATIFAVMAEYRPELAAAVLAAGADDLWHCRMQAPECWARLTATVRRREMALS